MNLFDTLSGLAIAAEKLRSDIGVTDRIMHEINGKIMTTPSQYETKRAWTELYQDWVSLALAHPLVRDPLARLSREDIQSSAIRIQKMREKALVLYSRWKSEMSATFSGSGAFEGSAPGNFKDRFLRGALVGAGIASGVAAVKAIFFDKPNSAPAPALPAGAQPIPIKVVLPPTPPMVSPRSQSFEFVIPPEAVSRGEDD